MSRMGFETTIPVFERAKTVHALDRAAGHCDIPFLALASKYSSQSASSMQALSHPTSCTPIKS
jgi:hypothetical protein